MSWSPCRNFAIEAPFLLSPRSFFGVSFLVPLGTAQPSTLESAAYSALKLAFEFVEEAPKSNRNAVVPACGADVAWLWRHATRRSRRNKSIAAMTVFRVGSGDLPFA